MVNEVDEVKETNIFCDVPWYMEPGNSLIV